MTLDEWLDACADQPDDDLLRFAFADWLEERGEGDRAEFIRLQVDYSRLPAPDHVKLKRIKELRERHRLEWLGPLVEVSAPGNWYFHRGLPEWLGHNWRDIPPQGRILARWLASPQLARVNHLDLRLLGPADFDEAAAQALAGSPNLNRLIDLDLNSKPIGDSGAAALAASPHLTRLTHLSLCHTAIGDNGAAALANAPNLKGLTVLALSMNGIGDPGAEALAASPHLADLRRLQLAGNPIGDAGYHALAASPGLARLQFLSIGSSNPRVGEPAKEALRQAFGDRVHPWP